MENPNAVSLNSLIDRAIGRPDAPEAKPGQDASLIGVMKNIQTLLAALVHGGQGGLRTDEGGRLEIVCSCTHGAPEAAAAASDGPATVALAGPVRLDHSKAHIGTVTVLNQPTTQAVTLAEGATIEATVSNFPAIQTVELIDNLVSFEDPVTVEGEVSISGVVAVVGKVQVGNFPQLQQVEVVSAPIPPSAFEVSNLPDIQRVKVLDPVEVDGTVEVSNFPAVQRVMLVGPLKLEYPPMPAAAPAPAPPADDPFPERGHKTGIQVAEVGMSATRVLEDSPNRLAAFISNPNEVPIYIGPEGVTPADGIQIASLVTYVDDMSEDAWYAVVAPGATGTPTIRVWEIVG